MLMVTGAEPGAGCADVPADVPGAAARRVLAHPLATTLRGIVGQLVDWSQANLPAIHEALACYDARVPGWATKIEPRRRPLPRLQAAITGHSALLRSEQRGSWRPCRGPRVSFSRCRACPSPSPARRELDYACLATQRRSVHSLLGIAMSKGQDGAEARELNRIGDELYALLDRNPQEALEAARSLQSSALLSEDNLAGIKAALLIDAGTDLSDEVAIAEGIELARGLVEKWPERLDLPYNLANGLSALAEVRWKSDASWHLETSSIRREARTLFASAVTEEEVVTSARARTNQANLLKQSFRWVEAYDRYIEAIAYDPSNSIASSGAAKILYWLADRRIGSPAVLRSVAGRLVTMAQASENIARQHGGERVGRALQDLPSTGSIEWEADYSEADDYARFVAEQRLALSPTIEGIAPSLKRWDLLQIESIREDAGDEPHGVPPIFAMFNSLKADFLTTRWLAFLALKGEVRESGVYADTLDYSMYGVRPALLVLAQRSAIDILDRIAVAASEYLKLPGKPNAIYFTGRWHLMEGGGRAKEPLAWQPEVEQEIRQGNTAVIALAELALDIMAGGFLNPHKTLRNTSTHRFAVLHDLSATPSRESNYVAHFAEADFVAQTVDALRVVRAALLYFVEMVALREGRLEQQGGLAARLTVPQHHWIRGEDEGA